MEVAFAGARLYVPFEFWVAVMCVALAIAVADDLFVKVDPPDVTPACPQKTSPTFGIVITTLPLMFAF